MRDNVPYQFLAGSENPQLAESDMEWGGEIGPIFLFNDDGIDGASQRRRIDLIVETFDVGEYSADITKVTHAQQTRWAVGQWASILYTLCTKDREIIQILVLYCTDFSLNSLRTNQCIDLIDK